MQPCNVDWFSFDPQVASITSRLVANHMATAHACDKPRESMLVSLYVSEPILSFGTMKQMERNVARSFPEVNPNSIDSDSRNRAQRDSGRNIGNDSAAEIHG